MIQGCHINNKIYHTIDFRKMMMSITKSAPRTVLLISIMLAGLSNPGAVRAQQNFMWWNEKHNWDGITHWSRYIISSPGYLGPNALPVPDIHNATLEKRMFLEPGTGFFIQPGEFVVDGTYRFFYPLAGGKAAVGITQTLLEYYITDTLLRDERRTRNRHVEGLAVGDLNFATYLMIVSNRRFPDVLLRINLRTASGNHFEDARYSDSPGYFFDLAAGKTVIKYSGKSCCELRFYGIIGFYAWQMTDAKSRQNDAFLYGVGSEIKSKRHAFSAEAGGYSGYIGMRDDPVVVRLKYAFHWPDIILQVHYQKGLHDVLHHGLHFTFTRFIESRDKPWRQNDNQ